jgi:ABC-2 type transport system permease protein
MGLRAFLEKEWYQLRRNIAVVLVILILLPGAAALGTSAYQQTVPEDVPVGIAPANDEVTEKELQRVQIGASLYATPHRYETPAEAVTALEREEVYLVFVIPHGLFEEGESVTVTQVSDQRLAQFRDPANYTESVVAWRLDRELPSDVSVEHERIGTQYTLSEFLVPSALMIIVVIYSFFYLPLELYREREIFDRIELCSRIESAITAKILFHALLLIVPLTVFQLVGIGLEYRIRHFSPSTMGIIGLSFVYMTALSGAIMFWSRLQRAGLFLNMGVMAGIFALSSFVFPVGFFSSVRKATALHLPTYHSMVIVRSTMLKEASLGTFADRIGWLVVTTVLLVFLLRWGINHYRRTR